jgi:hypothetical protein
VLADLLRRRGPRGADLDLDLAGREVEAAEGLGQDAGDGAGQVVEPGAVVRERLVQPGPPDLAEQRVLPHLRVERGAREDDDPEVAVPGRLAVRVVEDDEPSVAEEAVRVQVPGGGGDLGGESGREGREPGRGGHLLEVDLPAQAWLAQRQQRPLEPRGYRLT